MEMLVLPEQPKKCLWSALRLARAMFLLLLLGFWFCFDYPNILDWTRGFHDECLMQSTLSAHLIFST